MAHQKFGIATHFYWLTEGDVERLAIWVDAALAIVPAESVPRPTFREVRIYAHCYSWAGPKVVPAEQETPLD
jgi:hypothetical protein